MYRLTGRVLSRSTVRASHTTLTTPLTVAASIGSAAGHRHLSTTPLASSTTSSSSSIITTNQIRQSFLQYFARHDHTIVPSSSLLPPNDPSLLFTNSGMVQFKDVFTGVEQRPYATAASVQLCMRCSGKHNDLDNVGYTARHHTLFEMLGNFSFGDTTRGAYFKERAIKLAWDYVTKELLLPASKLSVTVFETDDEAAAIWKRVTGWGPQAEDTGKIRRCGQADNYWTMGEGAGPQGPCTELFWDQGELVDGDRWLEIWNLVFMQHHKRSPHSATLTPLSQPCVDTGMGLERVASVLQHQPTNYDIDSTGQLVEAVRALCGRRTGRVLAVRDGRDQSREGVATRVVVDHLRAMCFLVADGVLPAAGGPGYVLRRIIRRALRFGSQLGFVEPFLADLYPALVVSMGDAYPQLITKGPLITATLTAEERLFQTTLARGEALLGEAFVKYGVGGNTVVPGSVVFLLFDSFGFPADLTAVIARERGWTVDTEGFETLMQQQRSLARSDRALKQSGGGGGAAGLEALQAWQEQGIRTEFTGYDRLQEVAKVLAVEATGEEGWVAITPCPFYAQGGGQCGDRGSLQIGDHTVAVLDAIKPYTGCTALRVKTTNGEQLSSIVKVSSSAVAVVTPAHRSPTAAHHTATHLLQAALSRLGEQQGFKVAQAGSSVTPERLRFDFSCPRPLTQAELSAVEAAVNATAVAGRRMESSQMTLQQARERKAVALFGEKYDSASVRVVSVAPAAAAPTSSSSAVHSSSSSSLSSSLSSSTTSLTSSSSIGDSSSAVECGVDSVELCGGTHVDNTLQCYPFKIVAEGSVSAGTRRIEAVAGRPAVEYLLSRSQSLSRVAELLEVPATDVESRVTRLIAQLRAAKSSKSSTSTTTTSASTASSPSSSSSSPATTSTHQWEGLTVELRSVADAFMEGSAFVTSCTTLRRSAPAVVVVLCAPSGRIAVVSDPHGLQQKGVPKRLFDWFTAALPGGGKGGGDDTLVRGKLSVPEGNPFAALVRIFGQSK